MIKNFNSKQLLTRLPILLAQIKAGNNSNKLKNEIRQILHLYYHIFCISLLKLLKTVHDNLMKSL